MPHSIKSKHRTVRRGRQSQLAPTWKQLLEEAVTTPGLVHNAYFAFHEYSLSNRMAVISQCRTRRIPAGPINTFAGWKRLGRSVRAGEKALYLCVPVALPNVQSSSEENEEENDKGQRVWVAHTQFRWRANWFVLCQTESETDGAASEASPPTTDKPEWDQDRALQVLDVQLVPFQGTDGNTQGYATGRKVAVSPLAALPHKILFHELAHVVLGHTEVESLSDANELPKNLREAEAEGTAYLLCEILRLPGVEYSRGYLQSWLNGETIPESSTRRIFTATDKILKAGITT